MNVLPSEKDMCGTYQFTHTTNIIDIISICPIKPNQYCSKDTNIEQLQIIYDQLKKNEALNFINSFEPQLLEKVVQKCSACQEDRYKNKFEQKLLKLL